MALQSRIRNVTAVLGPTNTGKTHLAIERMLGHPTGMIGLPLRLLAREVYDKIVARIGPASVALVTGEEKIKPEGARYWVSTVEAMPRDVETDFLAIDEIQLAADPERGHVFTDRLLHARGRHETLMLGAGTMRDAISDLIPGANFISRPRLSKISYSGQKKITRLPKRTAIVAYSAAEVYAVAELLRRQIGGAAVVLGALSPRTRNAQVALYQNGDVDYLVATDAIGMGLNLDVDHIAFAGVRKFDGQVHRSLTPGELAQVAGRAGRHLNDGTFGVTGDVEPFDAELVDRLENHTFDAVRMLQWRNRNLDTGSLEALRESLRQLPGHARLQRARMNDDVAAFETLSADRQIAEIAASASAVAKLWEVCQVPDYRKISSQNHAELVATLFGFLMSDAEHIPEDWFARQVGLADRTDGDIDTLANRLAHIRTWTFVSNRNDWLANPAEWQERTRKIEDSLSDALHEQLTLRFVDRKTSALMKGLRDKEDMTADIGADGAITVENHFVGRLRGFRFTPDATSDAQGVNAKTARNAATHVVAKELGMRARRVTSARTDAFKLTKAGRILWRDEEIARLEPGEDPLKPSVHVLADEYLTGPDKEKVQQRLDTWITEVVAERLKSLVELKNAEDISGLARGIAFRLVESFGNLKREVITEEIRQLDQTARAQLRKYGVRFGAFNVFMPLLLKPAPAELTLALWAVRHAEAAGLTADALPEPPRPGLTSSAADPAIPEAFYRAVGYHVCGPRAVRIDILERLADLIRPLLAWRASEDRPSPPRGSSGDGGFIVTPEMMSILGCSADELGNVLRTLGFRSEKRPAPPKPAPRPMVAVDQTPTPAASEGLAAAADGELAEPAPVTLDEATPATDAPPVDLPTPEIAATAEPETAPETAAEAPSAAIPQAPTSETEPAAAASEPDPVAATHQADTAEASSADIPALPEADIAAQATSEETTSLAQAAGASEPATSDASEPSAAAPAEPEMIEVWRPRRRERGDRRASETRGRDQDGPRERTPSRDRRGDRDRRPRPTTGPQGEGSTPATSTTSEGGQAANPATEATPPTAPAETREPRRDGGGRDQRHQRRDGAPPGPRRDDRDQRGPRRDRDNRGDDRRRPDDRPRPQLRTTSTPRNKGGVDPDSPFAALSALKSQLEKQAKERGTT